MLGGASAKLRLGVLIVAAVLAIAGCGDEETSKGGASTAASDSRSTEGGALSFLEEVAPYQRSKAAEPRPDIPLGPPPRELRVEDFREGSGPEVEQGDEAIVNYVGYHYGNRKQYDTSYDGNSVPYKVMPGAGDFIEGFEQGIVGMRLGGRRQVTIPPHLGYGKGGYSDQVRPGETLVFVIDVEALEKH